MDSKTEDSKKKADKKQTASPEQPKKNGKLFCLVAHEGLPAEGGFYPFKVGSSYAEVFIQEKGGNINFFSVDQPKIEEDKGGNDK